MNNKFRIYLTSNNAITGHTTPNNCIFNIGSIYDNAPSMERYAEHPYCFVKVSYFAIEKVITDKRTLLINLDCPQPNTIESRGLDAGYDRNFISSNIIGVVPTQDTSATYCNNTYDNTYTCISNIFKGNINIVIKDQNSETYTLTSSESWDMLLDVYFEE
jgi:hypothetical protein